MRAELGELVAVAGTDRLRPSAHREAGAWSLVVLLAAVGCCRVVGNDWAY